MAFAATVAVQNSVKAQVPGYSRALSSGLGELRARFQVNFSIETRKSNTNYQIYEVDVK
ncbi:hypothetical protein RsS62_64410 [Rhizobium dioscoreae]|nr:hypothetical protein RsS62_64410 [Rhizobium dioscoreae]